ncbi:hypothetical protein Tco_0893350 [Tanacetum coccineum]|uniref:Uncharacterized protein n=1 Tax=Tanacetum coccineum TaxID=301880 RepID=A0ABQ5CBN6_9ASTR
MERIEHMRRFHEWLMQKRSGKPMQNWFGAGNAYSKKNAGRCFKKSSCAQNVAFVSQAKAALIRLSSGFSGALQYCTLLLLQQWNVQQRETHEGKKERGLFYQHQEVWEEEQNQMGFADNGIDGIVIKKYKYLPIVMLLETSSPDYDYYEKKMAREAEVKRVVNTGNRVTKPVWTNANRVNHANQFVPRSVQLNAGRPKLNSVRPNINNGNKDLLEDFEEFNGGIITLGRWQRPLSAKGFACLIAKATFDDLNDDKEGVDRSSLVLRDYFNSVLGKFDGKSDEGFLVGASEVTNSADLPHGMKVIGLSGVNRNKRDEEVYKSYRKGRISSYLRKVCSLRYSRNLNLVKCVSCNNTHGAIGALTKDEKMLIVDVHLYRSMIGFAEMVDFLRGSNLRYALTSNPTIYDSLVKQFWQTATAKTLADGTLELHATIDTIVYTITEASIRNKLQLADAFSHPNEDF